jgi:hypothetical protein
MWQSLVQWHIDEKILPNFAFLAKQIIGILESQIEKKGILILLKWWHLYNSTTYKWKTLIKLSLWWNFDLMIHILLARRKWIWKNTWKHKHLWSKATLTWLKKIIFWGVAYGWLYLLKQCCMWGGFVCVSNLHYIGKVL